MRPYYFNARLRRCGVSLWEISDVFIVDLNPYLLSLKRKVAKYINYIKTDVSRNGLPKIYDVSFGTLPHKITIKFDGIINWYNYSNNLKERELFVNSAITIWAAQCTCEDAGIKAVYEAISDRYLRKNLDKDFVDAAIRFHDGVHSLLGK